MRQLPPLSTLRAFEATARTGSVTRAAQELSRTHGAISRQLRLLQAHAGTALFDKHGTGLTLNEPGTQFLAVVQSVFGQLENGYKRVQDHARGPSLHVACSATFAMRWLVPHLPDFYRLRPDIKIRLSMTSAREIRTEGADLLIAWDLSSYSSSDQDRAIDLAPVRFGPVCAPTSIASLRTQPRITHDFTASAWNQWDALSGKQVGGERQITFPHTHLCIEAAASGLGVALVEQRLVRRELTSGQLVAPCGFVEFASGWRAVPIAGRAPSRDAEVFMGWVRHALQEKRDTAVLPAGDD